MIYADFPYYQDFYAGRSITDAAVFRTAAARSSEYIDSITFGRINGKVLQNKSIKEKIQNCCCAIAETMAEYQICGTYSGDGTGAKKSESQHNYSVTYSTPVESLGALLGSNATLNDYLHSIAMRYLGSTGLMYRGVY